MEARLIQDESFEDAATEWIGMLHPASRETYKAAAIQCDVNYRRANADLFAALTESAALRAEIATLRADATKAAEELERVREEGTYANGFIDGREFGYATCGSCEHLWDCHDGECGAYMKDGSICGCTKVISSAELQADLARERERHQDLLQVVKKYREQCYHCFEGITCEVCVLAEPLLEPQPAPVAIGEEK